MPRCGFIALTLPRFGKDDGTAQGRCAEQTNEEGAIAGPRTMSAIRRLEAALARLHAAAALNAEASAEAAAADDDRARLAADRADLADRLDKSEARAARLLAANREVEERLVAVMEKVRRMDGGTR